MTEEHMIERQMIEQHTTLIVLAGRRGTSRQMGERIAAGIDGAVKLADLREEKAPPPEEFTRVILGGSIRAGQLPAKLRRYLHEHYDSLRNRDLGLFLCSLREEDVPANMERAFGTDLLERARATAWLGGRLIMSDYGPLLRSMLRKVMGAEADVINLRHDAADDLARRMDSPTAELES